MKDGLMKPDSDLLKPVKNETYNRRTMRLALHAWSLPPIDTADPEQVQERISEYFDFCETNNYLPCVCGLSNWLGVHRDTLHTWRTGEYRKKTHQRIIESAYNVLESMLVDMLMNDRISAPTGIFLLKSVFGYQDRFDVGLEAAAQARRDPFADLNTEEAMKRLLEKYRIGGDEIDRDGEDSHSGADAGTD